MSEPEADVAFPVFDPVVEPELQPYWQGAQEGRVVLPCCSECGAVEWVPRAFCRLHPRAEIEWTQASGRGTVYSYTRVHKGEGPFAAASPYVLAYVELDEGPRVLTNIVGSPDEPKIGQAVTAVFDQRSESGAILRFALATDETATQAVTAAPPSVKDRQPESGSRRTGGA